MKRAISAVLAAVVLAACVPTPPPAPVVGGYEPGKQWLYAIERAMKSIFGHPPYNPNIDCAVVIFDQSINPNDYKAHFTPVHTPNDIYAWLTGCFGAQWAPHVVPTYKATGYVNNPAAPKKAVCFVTNFNPDGDMMFTCNFTRQLPEQGWVPFLPTNYDGYFAVGAGT